MHTTHLGLHLITHAGGGGGGETAISNTGRFFCFNSTVSSWYNNSVVEKKPNDMTFNTFFC